MRVGGVASSCALLYRHSLRLLLLFLCLHWLPAACAAVVSLDENNIDQVLKSNDVVFVNFYADWCRFSQMLSPVFEEASNKAAESAAQGVFAKLDCDRHQAIAQKYSISKYPTLKLFRNGDISKREYRGQRSVEALAEFVVKQAADSLKLFQTSEELERLITKEKRNIIAYFSWAEGDDFTCFKKTASSLREDCEFWYGAGDAFKQQTIGGNNAAFREPNTVNNDQLFTGDMSNCDYFKQWAQDKCVPLVRELTFENAEELTEEGVPFLILFREPDDKAIAETFTQEVAKQLADLKSSINALIADGKKFAHPLHHLGKSTSDLPIIAIDSFRHMYLFADMNELTVAGKLREFVTDLHSGKLHREFHHGPDPTQPQPIEQQATGGDGAPAAQPPAGQTKTDPPESVFKKLMPDRTRYTLLRDEL